MLIIITMNNRDRDYNARDVDNHHNNDDGDQTMIDMIVIIDQLLYGMLAVSALRDPRSLPQACLASCF